jgi:hypothetical protein
MSVFFAGIATLVLSGCGGGSTSSEPITDFGYFIIEDSQSFDLYSVEGLEYDCGLGVNTTNYDGKFEYVVGAQCIFTFIDLDDLVYAEVIVNDIDLEVDLYTGNYIMYNDALFDEIDLFGFELLNFYM